MTTTPIHASWRSPRSLLAAAGISILALAGCASSGGTPGSAAGSTGGGAGGATGSATTVQIRTVAGNPTVLTDAHGRTLYSSDQETGGKALCTSSACTAIWLPLTMPAGQQPTGPAPAAAALSTLTRPDGTTQVTVNGTPVYTFSFDHSAGQNSGNGQSDSFDGTAFTWHTATTNGPGTGTVTSPPSSSSTPSPYNNGGGSGY